MFDISGLLWLDNDKIGNHVSQKSIESDLFSWTASTATMIAVKYSDLNICCWEKGQMDKSGLKDRSLATGRTEIDKC